MVKNINLTNLIIFSAVILATTTYGLTTNRIEAKSLSKTLDAQLSLLETLSTHQDLKPQDVQKNLEAISSLKQQSKLNLFLADKTEIEASSSDRQESQAKFIRLISLSFLLLFFVPLGIFYPLFLFYRMLLIKPDEYDEIADGDREEKFFESIDSIDSILQAEQEVNRATVSKLQIAFSPPASHLREELDRVTLMTDLNAEHDVVDLMHQTVAVLIEQGHWTHASYSLIALPLKKVRSEFDLISAREKTKFISKTPSLINHNYNVSNNDGYLDYSYVVVTLILCTTHAAPLFPTINTKEQLVKELLQLGKMQRNSVIQFELLWNPQQEGVYLSNTQLLTEYADMTRLF